MNKNTAFLMTILVSTTVGLIAGCTGDLIEEENGSAIFAFFISSFIVIGWGLLVALLY
jgi:hypothetical protein